MDEPAMIAFLLLLQAPAAPANVKIKQLPTWDAYRAVVTWNTVAGAQQYQLRIVAATTTKPPAGTDFTAAYLWHGIDAPLTSDTAQLDFPADSMGPVSVYVRACTL